MSELRTRAREEAGRRAGLARGGIHAGPSSCGASMTEISSAESELALSGGGDDLGDRLVRFEALRERGRGLRAVLAERLKGIERDRTTLAVPATGGRPGGRVGPGSRPRSARLHIEAVSLAPEAEVPGRRRGRPGCRLGGLRGGLG